MPVYQFRNIDTNEIEEHMMSYTKLDEFKDQNPHLERHFAPEHLPVLGDSMRMSLPKYSQGDSAFEHNVIQRIKETVPGNTLHKTHKTQGSKWV
jgi:hypothetical protein